MLESMTGFGRCERTDEHGTVLVEVRSVNGRYLKVQMRVSELLQSREAEIESLVRKRLGRGTVTVTVHLKPAGAAAAWQVNADVVRAYADALETLREERPNSPPIRLEQVAALPGAVEPNTRSDVGQALWPLTTDAIAGALDALIEMRHIEGRALAGVLCQHADRIEALVESVAERTPQIVNEWHQRLRARVEALIADYGVTVADADLAREVAVYAERSDVVEELNRLRSHLAQFRSNVDDQASTGRTLEFLIQEMLREANTIAAKVNEANASQQVVLIKGELDRMKEQIQNVA